MTDPKTVVTADKQTDSLDAELVQQVFGAVSVDTLPHTLATTLAHLARLAVEMHPDDISLSLDMPAGCLMFRAYRRPRDR